MKKLKVSKGSLNNDKVVLNLPNIMFKEFQICIKKNKKEQV